MKNPLDKIIFLFILGVIFVAVFSGGETENISTQQSTNTQDIDYKKLAELCAAKTVTDELQKKSYEEIFPEDTKVSRVIKDGNNWMVNGTREYFHEALENFLDNPNVDNSDNTTEIRFSCIVSQISQNNCSVSCEIDGIVSQVKGKQKNLQSQLETIIIFDEEYNLERLIETCTVVKETWANPNGNRICNEFKAKHPTLYP